MIELYKKLLDLQGLDKQIADNEASLDKFDPQIQEVEAPVTALHREIENTRVRLTEMRQQSRKLEQAADHKRERLKAYEARLERLRTAREEAASRIEMDLVGRAIDADEQEALELMDQSKRTDLKIDDMDLKLIKLRNEVEPRKQELLEAKRKAEEDVFILRDKRNNQAAHIDPPALRLYERVRTGKSRGALAPLKNGACGACYNLLPLQEQSEIKRATALKRCEACGVILYIEE